MLHPLLAELVAFERTCGTLSSGLTHMFSILLPFHTFLGYLLVSNHALSGFADQLVAVLGNNDFVYRMFQVSMYLLNLTLLGCLVGANQKHKAKIWYSSLKRVLSLYPLLSQLALYLTAFLLYLRVNVPDNLVAFALSAGVSLCNSVVFGNYHLKKEGNYQQSQQNSLVFLVGVIVHLMANCLLVAYGNELGFEVSAAIIGAAYLGWFLKVGYRLYQHPTARWLHLFTSALVISTAILYLLLADPENNTFDFAELAVILCIMCCFLYIYEQRRRFHFIHPDKIIAEGGSLKDNELNMDLLLEESDGRKDKETILVGMLAHHVNSHCGNPRCWSQQESVYDPVLKHTFAARSLIREKDSVLRFYLRCLYQKALHFDPNKQTMLDYCEFAISEFGDFSSQCLYLGQLSASGNLGFFEKVKVTKLRLMLQ
jgi:small basic protein